MSASFQSRTGLIIVDVSIEGPDDAQGSVRLALDTGSTYTVLSASALVTAGYDVAAAKTRVEVTTASGVEYSPRMTVRRIAALGIEKLDFPILTHTLPPSAGVDGLLGLDFLRGRRLVIDFRAGLIEVS